jgi:hypothetical protein
MRRATAAAIILTFLTSAIVTAAMCEGWESSASARMDCCAAMGHECEGQSAADACCGRAELAQQKFETAASTYVPDSPLVAGPVIVLPQALWPVGLAAASAFERTLHQHPHTPPLLLSSVLLI